MRWGGGGGWNCSVQSLLPRDKTTESLKQELVVIFVLLIIIDFTSGKNLELFHFSTKKFYIYGLSHRKFTESNSKPLSDV